MSTMTRNGISIGDAVASLLRDGMPVRFTAYDGSSAGPADAEIGMRPVWLCPLKALGRSDGGSWPTYPLEVGLTYVNVGFWGTVHVGPEAVEAPKNRAIEAKVHRLGGHKSLYSEAFYDQETFDQLYDGAHLAQVKDRYDPDHRLTTLYDKAVKRR